MATELPSLSKELDKHLTSEVVPGEVNETQAHYVAMFMLEEREAANTPAPDLWSFHIQPAIVALAKKLNTIPRGTTRRLPLPPEGASGVHGAFISADGKLPLRFTIVFRGPDEEMTVGRYIYIIDTLFQEV